MAAPLDAGRRAELATSLAALRPRLVDAAAAAGRDPRAITLIAVTKTFPATDAAILAELGVHDVAENRDQEARHKVAEATRLLRERDVAVPRWHFVGQLQTNKARSVVRYADVVHSVDRPHLARALADAVRRADRRPLEVFVQVSLDRDPHRGGVEPPALPALAEAVVADPDLRLLGVMAVAPQNDDPDRAFAALAELSAQVRAVAAQASAISAGMSGDFEQALRHGATHLRIGSALLGHRSPMVG